MADIFFQCSKYIFSVPVPDFSSEPEFSVWLWLQMFLTFYLFIEKGLFVFVVVVISSLICEYLRKIFHGSLCIFTYLNHVTKNRNEKGRMENI